MRATNHLPSVCRYCRHYDPQGRRGGTCQQLNVPVRGSWQACSLASAPFLPTWETWETITLLETPHLHLAKATHKSCSLPEVEVSLHIEEEHDSENTLSV